MPKVEIEVSEEMIQYMESVTQSGEYGSTDEVYQLALLDFQSKRERLIGLLEASQKSFEDGGYTEFNSTEEMESHFENLFQKVRDRQNQTYQEVSDTEFTERASELLVECQQKRTRVLKDKNPYAILLSQKEYVRLLHIEQELKEHIR